VASNAYRLWRFLAFLIVTGLLLVSMIIYSAETGLRMSQRYTPLIDAAMEIKLEAALGHLLLEETLHKERPGRLEDVLSHLNQADWYAQAMLEGGTNAEGTFIPLNDPLLRQYIVDVRNELVLFEADIKLHWRNTMILQSKSDVDKVFDATFYSFIEKADIVETHLQRLIKQAERRFIVVQIILAVGAVGVVTWLGLLFKRFIKTQNRALEQLQSEIQHRLLIEQTLREQATTDTLTGLLNRRSMLEVLQDELNRAHRLGSPFSVIMFDIDLFKVVNDSFGHEAGDTVLSAIATRVTSRLRDVDSFARWGGEEFLLLLPGTDRQGAIALAETCREIIADSPMQGVGQITASFGVADYGHENSVAALIRRADSALYEAKNKGRNRVEASITDASPAAL
jgi:diguanylate cyclase (GGDEF)-like protein